MEGRGHGRTGAWVVSLAAHALLAVALLALPDRPESPPKPRRDVVELVWLGEVPTPGADTTRTTAGPVTPPTEAPAPERSEPAPPGVGARSPAAASPRGPSPEASAPPPEAPVGDGEGEGGLALSGLRGRSSSRRSSAGVSPAALVQPPARVEGPSPVRPALGPVARSEDWEPRSMKEAGFRKRKDGSYKMGTISSPFVVIVQPDGRVRFRDRLVTITGTSIHPNLLSAQKLAREEEFRGIKMEILRQTAELRMQLARSWSKKHMRTQLAAMSTQLKTTWGRPSWTLERRRKQLFLLWDECEERVPEPAAAGVDDTLDVARADAGEKARAMIVRFIREELPANSEHAYPVAEVRALNGIRASRQRFLPYASR